MAIDQDTIRLALEVEGQDKIERAITRLGAVRAEIKDLQAAMDRGAISGAHYAAEMDKLTAAEERLLGKLELSANKFAASGQSMLQTGRIVQDFTSGFAATGLAGGINAITNNVEGLVRALGGPAGLAGWLTIVAVGAQLLMPHLKSLYEEFTKDASKADEYSRSLEGMKEKLKELTEQKYKVEVDQDAIRLLGEEIKKVEEGIAAFKKATEQPSDEEKEIGSKVESALNNAPGGRKKLEEDMRAKEILRLQNESQDYQDQQMKLFRARQAYARISDTDNSFNAQSARSNAQKDINDALAALNGPKGLIKGIRDKAEANIGNLGKDAAKGNPAAIDALQDALAGSGHDDLANSIGRIGDALKAKAAADLARALEDLNKGEAADAAKFAADDPVNKQARERAENREKDIAEINRVRLELLAMDEAKKDRGEAVTKPQGGFEVETTAAERIQMAKQARELDEKLEKDRREGNRKDLEDNVKRFTGGPRGLDVQAGAALAQNRFDQVNGVGVNDAAFQREMQQEIARFLFANRATGTNGRPLTRQQTAQIAAKVVSDAAAQERANFADITSRAADGFEVMQGVQQANFQAMARFNGRLNAVEANGRQMIGQFNQIGPNGLAGRR